MKIVGITKIRNEQDIIKDTLNHFAQFCNAGIYIYDDVSTDNTVEICKTHPAVKDVILGKTWNPNRFEAEWQTKQAVLKRAQQDNPDWIIYFDADERIEFDFSTHYLKDYDAVMMKLFDFYITKEDVDKSYKERKWLGCEYRRKIGRASCRERV
jgi:glycosyltransferase involved in cell wall biosynthesis